MNIKKLLIIVVLFTFIVITISSITQKNNPKVVKPEEDIYESINLFTNILYEVKQSYYKDISFTTLINYAIEGMLEKLDPYSSYLKAEDFESLNSYTNGELYGLGIQYFKNKNNMIEILHVIDNSPAKKVGILSGDILLSINNKPVSYLGVVEVSHILQEKDTNIKLELAHRNNHLYHTTLNKEKIKIDDISTKKYDDILYIKIPTFNKNTATDLQQNINKNKNMNALILDLRNNGGGLFNQAIETADLFLDNKMIAKLENTNNANQEVFMANAGDILNTKPIVVLIDDATASSSEILAGSLQENRRAIVVGTKSFGKGVVQDILSLGNGDYIKLTTSQYVLPSNKQVDNIGIMPDIIIYKNGDTCTKCSEEQLQNMKEQENIFILENTDYQDYQLNKALEILQIELTKKD
ncbi:MAG: S41 family peptidase [Alphaproteobacteria bacterium]|jgi:carboxyl-terminal processing protease|nr:S41 family peptidase [Alphaproteobacteria bacterium]